MAETDQAPDPLSGRLVGQKFRIDRLLGAGAMGRVYLAEQTNLGKPVALKVLHASMAGDPALAKRFYREAKSASMLAHPNILQIIDFGDDDGLLFIAMELLSGRDLYRAIKADWPLSFDRIGHIGAQILSALDEAHAKGVVHRDLKPENVMLLDVRGEPDFVKVCDFGIAKIASEREGEGSAITVAGMICGTPEYMSPEQAKGEPLDGRSDLYSAATILYQMVVGDVPFRAESALGVITKQLHEPPKPPSQRQPNSACPPALEAVILRGLQKRRDDRFASAAEMKLALLESLGIRRAGSSGAGVVAHAGGGALSDVAMAATGVSPASAPSLPPAAGSRGPRLIAVLAALGLAGLTTYMVVGRDNLPHQPAVAAPPVSPQIAPPVSPQIAPPVSPQIAPPQEKTAIVPIPDAHPVVAAPVFAMAQAHKHEKRPSAAKTPISAGMPAAGVSHDNLALSAAPSIATNNFGGAFAAGEQLFRSGDVEGALARYQEAARLNPMDPKTQRQIGKCYNRLGQRDRALPFFKRYLELAPDASDGAFIRAMLDGK